MSSPAPAVPAGATPSSTANIFREKFSSGASNLFTSIGLFLLSLLPKDFTEAILFTISIALIVIIVMLCHYTSINRRIINESRCYREKQESNIGSGIYKVTAYTTNGDELYEVLYDIGAKTYVITQKCPEGTIQNKTTVRVYDLKRRMVDKIEKILSCTKNYELNVRTPYYRGDPALVRFMEYGNSEFFDKLPL